MFHNKATLIEIIEFSRRHFSNPIAIGKLSHHVKVCLTVRDFSPANKAAGDGISTIKITLLHRPHLWPPYTSSKYTLVVQIVYLIFPLMKLKKLELLNEDYEADPLLLSFQNKASYLFLHYYCLGLLIYTRLFPTTSSVK